MAETLEPHDRIPRFERRFRAGESAALRIGDGRVGGKAAGLVVARDTLARLFPPGRFPGVEVRVPTFAVLTTDVFEAFMEGSGLRDLALSDAPDDRIAHAFQAAPLPAAIVGDLKALARDATTPLAVRSSGLLEDVRLRPFAGVYGTKMTPNNQPDPDDRFRRLVQAIKFVWASTYFSAAKAYARASGRSAEDERMAVIVQEVVGLQRGRRYYPQVSAVARSWNFYPVGGARREDGVVDLALGLGKWIVDGGLTWAYSPARPKAPPPFGSTDDLLRHTQLAFWAINMDAPVVDNPVREDEHLLRLELRDAELDGALDHVASTLDTRSGRLAPGLGMDGPRVVDFSPLLQLGEVPLNDAVRELLGAFEHELGSAVELELAMTLHGKSRPTAQLGFVQVRPMQVSHDPVDVTEADAESPDVLVLSDRVMGNGEDWSVLDVVHVRRDRFEPRLLRSVAIDMPRMNADLVDAGRPYLLVGFGRWGSADPWLGVPVQWSDVSGARAIVEATRPDLDVEPSQGSHFFHNISAFGVSYFTVRHDAERPLDWDWLEAQPAETEGDLLRHVRLEHPLAIKVDGRTGRGVIRRAASPPTVEVGAGAAAAVGGSAEEQLAALRERAKELECLYRVDDVLNRTEDATDELMAALVRTLPAGWMHPDIAEARIVVGRKAHATPGFRETEWMLTSPVSDLGETVGAITVCYTEERPPAGEGPFLPNERQLLDTIANRLGFFLAQRRLQEMASSWQGAVSQLTGAGQEDWRVVVKFLRRTDVVLLRHVTRKMINHLAYHGIPEAAALLERFAPRRPPPIEVDGDSNVPLPRRDLGSLDDIVDETFRLAASHFEQHEILESMHAWIRDGRTSFLAQTVEETDSSFPELASALQRFRSLGIEEDDLSPATRTGLRVALLRRFFAADLSYISAARPHVRIADFEELVGNVVAPTRSRGWLGGKSAGIFFAWSVLRRCANAERFADLRLPRTLHVASDALLDFVRYNDLDDVFDRKYMDVEQIRQDYPQLVQLFKNSHFPPDLVHALSAAIDELGEVPIIVRSSSLLEDRTGSAFSGKYKSLFLANQGSRRQRLAALQDAIAEVYASAFGPDPIQYRAERQLLDVREEMGIMIQPVVGTRVGRYFFPSFSGVVFGHAEFRWSPRIRREDGLARIVPGLGTRAVDRTSDDYPVLVAPGQPALRVNVTPEEVAGYAPRRMDLIDLQRNAFRTLDVDQVLREVGPIYPGVLRMVSEVTDGSLRRPSGLMPDFAKGRHVVTFEGLLQGTDFLPMLHAMMTELQQASGRPMDVEFASDGQHLYLLQCRPQNAAAEAQPATIPRDVPPERVIFTAHRHVSNGQVTELTHVVYVDPAAYAALPSAARLDAVGRAVGRLNRLLPKRRFVLMGPGRWGSRGDLRLGVPVTYSDVNNAAMLIEIERRVGSYVPEPSFGTHFFQDMVEAGIRYLPLYPDAEGVTFQESFFQGSPNQLEALVPEHADLAGVVHVIDVPATSGGLVLHVLMNGDLDEAVGFLGRGGEGTGETGRGG